MTIQEQERLAKHIMRLLKVRYVSFPIAVTEKGPISIKYVKDTDRYQIVLDAVPLSFDEYDHRELNAVFEKYVFDEEAPVDMKEHELEVNAIVKNKGGRPRKIVV